MHVVRDSNNTDFVHIVGSSSKLTVADSLLGTYIIGGIRKVEPVIIVVVKHISIEGIEDLEILLPVNQPMVNMLADRNFGIVPVKIDFIQGFVVIFESKLIV